MALLSNAFAELDIWNGIKYKFQAGFDLGAKNYRDFTPSTAGGAMFTAPPQKASDNTTPTSTIVGLSKIC